jgi:hypothetical protein
MNQDDIREASDAALAKDRERLPQMPANETLDDLYRLGFARGVGWIVKLDNLDTDYHDDKPPELADRHVTTSAGDLDLAGRPLKQGS